MPDATAPTPYRAALAARSGQLCFGGLDLSATTDMSAFARLFPDPGSGALHLYLDYWLPADSIAAREQRDQVPYRQWAADGWLRLTEGDVIDYGEIEDAIIRDHGRFQLKRLMADPWNATKTCLDLKAKGVPVEFIRQGFLSLSGPTKELERLVLSRKIRHFANPVLRWNVSHAIAEKDAAGNIKLSKRKSNGRIDGLAAAVNAIAAYLTDPKAQASVYEGRGFIVIG